MKKIIIILFCFIFPLSGYAQKTFEEFITTANEELLKDNLDSALISLNHAESLARTKREIAEVRNAIGWTLFNAGDNEKAKKYLLDSFETAKYIDDRELAQKVSNNIGLVEYSMGDFEEAKQYFSNKWSANSDTSIMYMANIQKQEEQLKTNKIIATGVGYRLGKDFENAIAEYDKALDISPNNIRALEYKGYALFRLGELDHAIEVLESALYIEPDRINVIINLLKSYCALGLSEDATILIDKKKKIIMGNIEVFRGDVELKNVCGDIQNLTQ